MSKERTGVILMNMGGPDSLADVRPFLFNLFSDRQIIRLGPAFMQLPLAWLISSRRAPKSRGIYEKIGGGSPLKEITEQQAASLQVLLEKHGDYAVSVAMRYWPPSAGQAVNDCLDKGCTRLVALPLYPHYSRATSGSSISDLQDSLKNLRTTLPLRVIPAWPNQPNYISALAKRITKGLAELPQEHTALVYSAHSLPVSFIEEGDPYVNHLEQTVAAIETLTGVKGRLCYQSRSGPVTWLSPSTSETIDRLAEEGVKNIFMVPLSFVSDHVETLYEIGMLFRSQAEKLGMQLIPCPSLNTDPEFIEGLAALVLKN